MFINHEKCIMCGQCLSYCPMNCILEIDGFMKIDQEECVECGICLRNADCPMDAFEDPELEMPRYARKAFSNPSAPHKNTKLQLGGRGTEEIKTNEVTGLIHSLDRIEIAVEMGRPGLGARFRDVEIIAKAVSKFDIEFAQNNPVTGYMVDRKAGLLDPSILNEKFLSCILEIGAKAQELPDILDAIKEAAHGLETVFSVAVLCKVDENNRSIVEESIAKRGYKVNVTSSKTNLGLGKPRYEDRIKEGLAE